MSHHFLCLGLTLMIFPSSVFRVLTKVDVCFFFFLNSLIIKTHTKSVYRLYDDDDEKDDNKKMATWNEHQSALGREREGGLV